MENCSITKFQTILAAILFLAISLGAAAEEWVPPQDPDPEEIRRGANEDVREKRYKLASQKYAWYHENALKHQPSLIGVRVSFALMGWRNLANQYPPALDDIRRAQDRAEERVRGKKGGVSTPDDPDAFAALSAFQDAAALNNILKENSRTVELFKWLHEKDPEFAQLAYVVAQDALVEAGEFALCETYLTGRNSFEGILEDHERQLDFMEEHYGGAENVPHIDSHYMILARRVAFVIAILVKRDRQSDAEVIAEKAMRVLKDEEHRSKVDDALRGIPPERLM